MNSRERVLKTLNHEEPDRIPYDLGSTHLTGITNGDYRNMREYLGLEEEKPVWSDVIQQLVIPSEEFLNQFKVDTRGLFPLTSHTGMYIINWKMQVKTGDTMTNGE